MTIQTKLQDKPSIEKREFEAFMLSFKLTSKFRNQRLGQAFYNHFSLHKMNHGPEFNKLYELDAEQASKKIQELFTIH